MLKQLARAVLLAASATPSLAQTAPRKAPQIRIDFTQETLPNGLTVIYSLDKSTPVVAVEVMYNVGSKNEAVGRTGFAHLFEHVMFKGSQNVADGAHWALLEKAGARVGRDLNGTTSQDRTNYFEQVPSNYLELALWLESDRMGTLTETLTKGKLDNQREVVKNERRQSVDNRPYGTWWEKMLFHGFPDNHPYKHEVVGSMEDLGAASVEDVVKFFKTYYAPNNAVLVIAGDFDVDQTKLLVRKHFSDIPRGPAVPALRNMTVPARVGKPQREVVQDPNATAPVVFVGFRVPAARGVPGAAVSLLREALAGNRATPFYNDLVRDKQIAANVSAYNFGLVDGADLLVFLITGKADSNPDSLEGALLAEIGNAVNLVNDGGVEQAKASARFSFINGLQTTGGFGGRSDALALGFTHYRDANHVNTVLDDIDKVTTTTLKVMIAERLVPENRITLVYVPSGKAAISEGDRQVQNSQTALSVSAAPVAATAGAEETEKETPPEPGPLRKFEVPSVQTATLSNGLKIAVIERYSLPIITARIHIDAGAARESAAKSGIALVTANMLPEGSRELTGAEIAGRMAKLAAQFGADAGFSGAWVNITSLPNVFDEAFRIAATTVTEPRFDSAEFARIRSNQIAAFERSMSSASGVADRVFSHSVFDTHTPYARPSGGTKASLEGLVRQDVTNWYRDMYSPTNTTVMLIGDITMPVARALIERTLGQWTAHAPTLAKLDNKVSPVSATRVILVDRPGSVQTSIVVGQGTIGWGTPDYYAMEAAARVLGGGFASRINSNLREKHGWTYGAFATFDPLVNAGSFYLRSEVRTNATDSAIAESVREYKRIAQEPVPATELRDQVNNVVAGFPSSVQTVQGLMGRLSNVVTYGLPVDFYSTYREKLAAVTPDDVSRVGKSLLQPAAVTVVAVGDLKTIEAPIRALNFGAVEVWNAEGRKLR